ncbi:hypothetical protein ROZALSC1DRAFT_29075 [Rozella allomycis CSF55]|uniref:Hemerythrin-like domain-containing protein n=1 Tax=Rozella allomycis (strain CSF55) TaxID=988480 RepID=A0A075AX72_ROZAC|nr:hypothetical protein O9G_003100 [Rozella allomycis CSF55]RKP19310.1 hypothetical protein ROZALSC1DRAFT_29075 [Rozella allomycis CSF55]|eukprot:EPZ33104.1 hypothetical protein O9G_003100 [Rozella allomycis CSF55]
MRKYLPEGDNIVDHSLTEHLQVKKDLEQLESLNVEHVNFVPLVSRVMTDFQSHVQEEENDILPKFAQFCPLDELISLKDKFIKTKSTAPTRPHSGAPDTGGISQKVAGAAAAVVDKMKDTAREFVAEE